MDSEPWVRPYPEMKVHFYLEEPIAESRCVITGLCSDPYWGPLEKLDQTLSRIDQVLKGRQAPLAFGKLLWLVLKQVGIL